MSRARAGIWGASGYAGAELIRLCLAHPGLELAHLGSDGHAGESVDSVFPAFKGLVDRPFDRLAPEIAAGCDVLLSCLPHGESHGRLAPLVGRTRLIDLSGDFRLRDAQAYGRAYGQAHGAAGLLGRFVYGLPELHREAIRGADAVANPGCFATACALALLPLARRGWLAGEVFLSGVTGSSGSGIKPAPSTHHPGRSQDFYAYKGLRHAHEPEIAQTLGFAGASGFRLALVTHSAPLVRGLHVSAFASLPGSIRAQDVADAFHETFGDEPFVRFQPDVHVIHVRGLNHCDLSWTWRDGTVVVHAALDNLVKGAGGQAIQNLNLMLGFPETAGLQAVPMVV